MTSIDDIGYPPQRPPTPETNERYVLKGPTKSPPPIFMPKPVYAVAPTQKLVQQQLLLQQQNKNTQDPHQLLSSSAMVNSPKPEATAAAPVPAKASAITSNDQPRALLQQQQAAAGSSSRQPPPSASVSMSLHPDVSTVSYGNPNYPSPQHQALSPGKQQSHHQPQQQQQQQQQKQKQKQRQPLIYSPDYDEIVRENETLHQQLIVLTRENEKMERRCNIFADRIDNLERQIKKFAFLQQSFEKDGLDHGGGAADSFSENSISVSPMHSRSAPTATARGRNARKASEAFPLKPSPQYYHQHHHHHHHDKSRSSAREERNGYASGLPRRRKSYDGCYGESERDYEYYFPREAEEGAYAARSSADDDDDDDEEEWGEDEYLRPMRRRQKPRRPLPYPRSSRPARTQAPSLVATTAAAAVPPLTLPMTPRRPPSIHPGRCHVPLIYPEPSMAGMRPGVPGLKGSAGRNPDRRSLRHRHSESFYRLPPYPAAPRWRGEYGEDHMYDPYDDDENDDDDDIDYSPHPYRRASNRSRYI